MNDEFLKHLRAEPRAAFATDLRKRLARQQHHAGDSQGELVMMTPNKLSTASLAAGRRHMLVWGVLAIGAAGAIFALGALLGRATPQPPPTAAASPPLANSVFSTTPVSADALAAIDLDAAVPPSLENSTLQVAQVSKRVPDTIRKVPVPVQVRSVSLKQSGISVGNVTMLLYATVAERDQALAQMTRRVLINAGGLVAEFDPDELEPGYPRISFQPLAGLGEQALLRNGRSDTRNVPDAGTNITSEAQIVFARCGAAVQVRLSSTTPNDLQPAATEIAQTLDQQLAPLVCQAQ